MEKPSAPVPIPVLLLPALLLAIFGILSATPSEIIQGWKAILTSPSLLITDYLVVGGPGGAAINAATLGLLATIGIRLIGPASPGYAIAGVYLITGFGLFGKNILNIWPHIAGVWLFSRFTRRPLRDLFPPLVFGTTLAPIVSQYAFGPQFGIWGLPLGCALGVISGFLLAALAGHILSIHQGYTLYNIGTAGGFVGIVITMIMRGFGVENTPVFLWSTEYSRPLSWVVLACLSGLFLFSFMEFRRYRLTGAEVSGPSPANNGFWQGWKEIISRSGRLPCDLIEVSGLDCTLFNMGILGCIGFSYVILVGGALNGPLMAGILSLMGFGALGKHPRNVLPIMAGVFCICIPKIWSPQEPGPLLAALFCTSLAPFCGQFGILAGFVAGAMHLPMVMHIASIHGFLNLYNNGFAGGLTMTIIIGVIKGTHPEWLEKGPAKAT